jgi:hypothetical protein
VTLRISVSPLIHRKVQQIDRVAEVVEETLKGNRVRLLGPKKTNGKRAGARAQCVTFIVGIHVYRRGCTELAQNPQESSHRDLGNQHRLS